MTGLHLNDGQAFITDVEIWERRAIGGLFVVLVALAGYAWHVQDVRIIALESWRTEHMAMEAQQAQQLATVTAIQGTVLAHLSSMDDRLEKNGDKLNTLLARNR